MPVFLPSVIKYMIFIVIVVINKNKNKQTKPQHIRYVSITVKKPQFSIPVTSKLQDDQKINFQNIQ